MTGIPGAALLFLIAYLIGAIPFGLLVARLTHGVDLREHGSGRIGATNALRTVGLLGAVVVFVLDAAKGFVAVLLVGLLYVGGPAGSPPWVAAAAGIAAIAGHIRSVFIGFRGGRGVATFAGSMLAVAPWVLAVVVPVFAIVVWRTRYVSLGSLVAALLAPVTAAVFAIFGQANLAAVVLGVGGAALVVGAHADNIARLRLGTERRIGA